MDGHTNEAVIHGPGREPGRVRNRMMKGVVRLTVEGGGAGEGNKGRGKGIRGEGKGIRGGGKGVEGSLFCLCPEQVPETRLLNLSLGPLGYSAL